MRVVVACRMAAIGASSTAVACGGRVALEASPHQGTATAQASDPAPCTTPGIFFITQQSETTYEVRVLDPSTGGVSSTGLLPCSLPSGVSADSLAVDRNGTLFFYVDGAYGLTASMGAGCGATTFFAAAPGLLSAGLAFVGSVPGVAEIMYGSFFDGSKPGQSSVGAYEWSAASPSNAQVLTGLPTSTETLPIRVIGTFPRLEAIAGTGDGRLFGIATFPERILQIDPTSGAVTRTVPVSDPSVDQVSAIAFWAGSLYAFVPRLGSGPSKTDIDRIDLASGAATKVATVDYAPAAASSTCAPLD